ncbi:ABC transporter substrate-binding protein [Cryobacterium tepidiphilum]|uniref:Extracellular solute-binding protein n=1 Tax=Cryobacterium tepidiphilum TaxID=2486026 RepID=A0A3M8LNV4_9MICO|nr:extracellular solute-binding protein [Cryobacterium tepidiphilum]RNE67025.1 extracellular solute-binding protein [Cryobacterium tepidiphilum]
MNGNSLGRGSRRRMLAGFAALTAVATVTALAGCSGSTGPGDAGGGDQPSAAAAGDFPSYYPADYQSIVDGAKKEGGDLVIYSNTDQENWAPIFRDFQKKYPFVKISANNLESDEVFQRQLSEMATGNAPADLLVSNATQGWAEYASKPDTTMAYESPELSKLPDFVTLLPNVYAMSMDPIGMLYNTAVIDKELTSIKDLADYVQANKDKMKNKVTTRDVSGAFGFSVSKAWADNATDSWDTLAKVMPFARAETSSGTQKDKITSGEYGAGFLISGAVGFPAEKDAGGLLKFVLPKDGTDVIGRGIAITPKAPHVNTAKLFVDFVLSEDGQNAVAEGGLASYRDNVKPAEGLHTYQEVEEKAGKDNIIVVPYEAASEAEVKEFTDKWNGLLAK